MPNFTIHRPNPNKKPTHSLPRIEPIKYLQILFDDLQYDRLHRNDKLSHELGREIKFLDELKREEISQMIDVLREQKYGEEKK